jgi:putative ABC transport system permease protein
LVVRSDDLINRILGITEILGTSFLAGYYRFKDLPINDEYHDCFRYRTTREIGVRKALGAKRSTVAIQFFIETLLIGQLGGIVGIILGILIGYGIATALSFAFVIPW